MVKHNHLIRTFIDDLYNACKSRSLWRIGTEHEKFVFHTEDNTPVPYGGPRGIQAILTGLQSKGWVPIKEQKSIIGLKCPTTDGNITLEPGGQFELSGAPLKTLHETCQEVNRHLKDVKDVSDSLGIAFLGSGFTPTWAREDMPIMPKGRYDIMRRYMPTRGRLGLDMMFRTATVQVNLDFESESDMVEKFRIALALQPIATALFANSPFTNGKPNGYLSYRSHIWTDTDPDRCGMLPFVFEDGFGFERWVMYMLDVPLYFIDRDGKYLDLAGKSFQDFISGRLEDVPGVYPTLSDWHTHLTTCFPEVRLKHFLEMRGADAGPWQGLCALPALWTGLLYDSVAQADAWSLVKDWSLAEMADLRAQVPRLALKTPFRSGYVQDIAKEMVEISRQGLKRRGFLNTFNQDECLFLDTPVEIAASGITQAERLLDAYHGPWSGDMTHYFNEYRY